MHHRTLLLTILASSALILAGCLENGMPPEGEAQSAEMAPQTTSSLPLLVTQAPWDPQDVTISISESSGLDVGLPEMLHDVGNDTLAGWVQFTAPAGTSGTHNVIINVDAGPDGSRDVPFTLEVSEPEPAVEEGEMVTLHITGRTMGGELVLTTQEEIAEMRLPHSEGYEQPMATDPLGPIPVMHGQLPEEIVAGLLAIGKGQTITVEVPEFFGPESFDDTIPRQETVPRDHQEQRVFELPRQQAEMQGFIDQGAQVGDPVVIPQLTLDYVIASFDEHPEQGELVVIEADVEIGQRLTLHEAWPDAAEIVEVDDDNVHIHETPPYAPGEVFTWRDGWEDATEIVHMDEATIELRHSPEEGTTFIEPAQQPGMEPTEATVTSVNEMTITISRANPDPLAGQTILLDMHLVEIDPEQGAPPMGPGTGPGPGP